METRGRQLFYEYIDKIRDSSDPEINQKTFCAQYFMRKIDDIYAALNSIELMKVCDEHFSMRMIHDEIFYSMIYCLIFFMYGLFELIDEDFENNPVKKIRNKIGHGRKFGNHYAPLNNYTKDVDSIFGEHEFNDLMGCAYIRGDINSNVISLVWHFRKDDGTMVSKFEQTEYASSVDVRACLLEKLGRETLYIDTTGNFACNIDNLYKLACEKVECYLRENYGHNLVKI